MADALDSGSSGSNIVRVQVPSSAPFEKQDCKAECIQSFFFVFQAIPPGSDKLHIHCKHARRLESQYFN